MLTKMLRSPSDRTPNDDCDNKTTFKDRLKLYFPISKENAYGLIPMMGAVTSCFTVGTLISFTYIRYIRYTTERERSSADFPYFDYMRNDPQHADWFSGWYCTGFIIFVAIQVIWGFHAKNAACLLLWIICKSAEMLSLLVGVCCVLLQWNIWLMTSILVLILLLIMLIVGCVTVRKNKKSQGDDVLPNDTLNNVITK